MWNKGEQGGPRAQWGRGDRGGEGRGGDIGTGGGPFISNVCMLCVLCVRREGGREKWGYRQNCLWALQRLFYPRHSPAPTASFYPLYNAWQPNEPEVSPSSE